MAREVKGKIYLSRKEVMSRMDGASASRFNRSIKPYLAPQHFDGKRANWYPESQVDDLKNGILPRMADIHLDAGIQGDWSTTLRKLGYVVETEDCEISGKDNEGISLPETTVKEFGFPAQQRYIKRSRKTSADGVPICWWYTAYPLPWVSGEILEEMCSLKKIDVVRRIKDIHGLIITKGEEIHSARTATPDEQNLLRLVSNDPVFILERAAYTEDGTLVLYSYMVLLASWFRPRHKYPVDPKIWE